MKTSNHTRNKTKTALQNKQTVLIREVIRNFNKHQPLPMELIREMYRSQWHVYEEGDNPWERFPEIHSQAQ